MSGREGRGVACRLHADDAVPKGHRGHRRRRFAVRRGRRRPHAPGARSHGRRGPRQRGGVRPGTPSPRAASWDRPAAVDHGARGLHVPRPAADQCHARRGDPRRASAGHRGREVELWSEPFRAGDGRLLGALLGRVVIVPAERDSWPPPAILLELILPALLAFAVARFAGLRSEWAALTALVTLAFATSALWPSGLAHSPYGPRLCALLCAGSVLALAFALLVARRHPAAASAALIAFFAGWLVQVIAGTSPLMVVSDVGFHANKLAAVAAGDLFPVSVTQHAR